MFLQKLYETTGGNTVPIVDIFELGSELGFDKSEIENIVDYLSDEGLMELITLGGGSRITHSGIIEIEDSEFRVNLRKVKK